MSSPSVRCPLINTVNPVLLGKSFRDLIFSVTSPLQVKSLTSHRLVEPTFHLEEKLCKKHERLLERYCRTDHTCICTSCADSVHKSHDVVSADHEWKKKMVSVSPPLVAWG